MKVAARLKRGQSAKPIELSYTHPLRTSTIFRPDLNPMKSIPALPIFAKQDFYVETEGRIHQLQGGAILNHFGLCRINVVNYSNFLTEWGLITDKQAMVMIREATRVRYSAVKYFKPQKFNLYEMGGLAGLKSMLARTPQFTAFTTFSEFINMEFGINGDGRTCTGQTILRNVGLRSRSTENLEIIKAAFGYKKKTDLTNMEQIREVLGSLCHIDLTNITLTDFGRLNIVSKYFQGSGRLFLKFAMKPYLKNGTKRSVAFEKLLADSGINRINYLLGLSSVWRGKFNGSPTISKRGLIQILEHAPEGKKQAMLTRFKQSLRAILLSGQRPNGKPVDIYKHQNRLSNAWDAEFILPSGEKIKGQALIMRFGRTRRKTLDFMVNLAGLASENGATFDTPNQIYKQLLILWKLNGSVSTRGRIKQ